MGAQPRVWIGVILILLGVCLIVLPALGKYLQIEKIPRWLIYVYHHNNFYFATSPLLLAISALAIILFFLKHY